MQNRELPDWLDAYMELTQDTEPPVAFDRWVGISAIASALQRKCWVDRGITQKIYPNMYIVLIGPAGIRKSTAMSTGRSLLEDLGIHIASEATTREALISRMKNSSTRSTFEHGGIEKVHTSLTVHASELMVFVGQGRHNPQFLADLTDWFDAPEVFRNDTRGHGQEIIKGVWLNLIGATTPDLFQEDLSKIAIGGGLTSRMLFIYGDKFKKYVPFPTVTKRQLELYEQLKNDLGKMLLMTGPFVMTSDFKDAYVKWYRDTNENPPDLGRGFGAYISRRATHFLKLCQILSASRTNDMQLTEKDFRRAEKILSEAEKHMSYIFEGFGSAHNRAAVKSLLKFILFKQEVSEQEIMKEFIGDFPNKKELETVLHAMQAANLLKFVQGKGTYTILALKKANEEN